MRKPDTVLDCALSFVRAKKWAILASSAVLLVPCCWHRRIEAGDLASHVYNAWLAQLIEKGQAPGLYTSKQWNNFVFDVALLQCGKWLGLAAAEKIVVGGCVLIFFWGAFALLAAVGQRAPWLLVPCLAMLAYGWTFNIGFFNYYLSLGLGFFATAIFWHGRGMDLIAGFALAVLVFVAHPQGFLWLVGCVSYVLLWRKLPGRTKLWLPAVAAGAILAARAYLFHRYEAYSVWESFGPGVYNGSDQLALYGTRFYVLSGVALLFGVVCFAGDAVRRRGHQSWEALRLPCELHLVAVFATYLLPDVLRIPLYSGWIGALALRLTTVSAAMGLAVLALMQPKKWHTLGFTGIAALFFAFLYQDSGVLNRMEQQAERLVSGLPSGERVTATIWSPPDSRLPFIGHIVDRACIGRCFSFQNYEPASGQFRVRVREGSPVATDDSDTSQRMEAGEYVVRPEDLPMAQLYQCDEKDLTQLCVRQLAAGEANGRIGHHPASP